MEAGERLDLPEKLEVCPCDTICILWNNLNAYCPKQVGPEGHDVAARVKRLGVRVQRDGGRVVRSERMHECVFQARLMVNLMLQAGSRPRGVISGRLPEGVVQDQSPAGSAFVVLPHNMGIDTYLIPEPMGTCVEMLWFWSQNPWEINSFLAFALSRVVGKG